jgi:mannose-6-phosphate isomerase-like protein (cupin superfamily)
MKKGSKSKEQQEDTPETRHVGIDSENVHVFGTRSRLVATLGVSDLIIVENNDSTLICKSGRSEDIKKLVQHLEEQGRTEVEGEVVVHRPWGNYEVLMDTPTYKVKKIVVYPGAKLSLQSHTRRAEHWVVVTGVADVVNGDAEYQLNANESAYIKKGARHQLANSSDANLEIIEVQTGDYLGEDDITRYEDVYNRV